MFQFVTFYIIIKYNKKTYIEHKKLQYSKKKVVSYFMQKIFRCERIKVNS